LSQVYECWGLVRIYSGFISLFWIFLECSIFYRYKKLLLHPWLVILFFYEKWHLHHPKNSKKLFLLKMGLNLLLTDRGVSRNFSREGFWNFFVWTGKFRGGFGIFSLKTLPYWKKFPKEGDFDPQNPSYEPPHYSFIWHQILMTNLSTLDCVAKFLKAFLDPKIYQILPFSCLWLFIGNWCSNLWSVSTPSHKCWTSQEKHPYEL